MASRTTPLQYEISVEGALDERWSSWFDELRITRRTESVTVFTGPVVDQAALYGLLAKAHALGLTLITVRRIAPDEPGAPMEGQTSPPREADTMVTDTMVATRQVVEAFFQRLATGDPDSFTALLADDVDWLIPGDTNVAPWVGRRSTRSGVADYLRLLRANAEPLRAEVQHVLVEGDMAIAVGEFASRMLRTGKVVESIFFAQFVVRDGLVVRYRLLEDSQAVVAAMTA